MIAAFFCGFYARWGGIPDDIGLHTEVAKYMFTDKLGEVPEAVGAMAYFFLNDRIAGNFSWGYDLAVQFATIVSLACSRILVERNGLVIKTKKWVAYAIFAYQVYTGLQYINNVSKYRYILVLKHNFRGKRK